MKPANNAPVYSSIYADLAETVRTQGYALAIHGSVAKDFDLICIPWIENAKTPEEVIDAITSKFAMRRIDGDPTVKLHGRIAYTLCFYGGWGDVQLDLSFMPLNPKTVEKLNPRHELYALVKMALETNRMENYPFMCCGNGETWNERASKIMENFAILGKLNLCAVVGCQYPVTSEVDSYCMYHTMRVNVPCVDTAAAIRGLSAWFRHTNDPVPLIKADWEAIEAEIIRLRNVEGTINEKRI